MLMGTIPGHLYTEYLEMQDKPCNVSRGALRLILPLQFPDCPRATLPAQMACLLGGTTAERVEAKSSFVRMLM